MPLAWSATARASLYSGGGRAIVEVMARACRGRWCRLRSAREERRWPSSRSCRRGSPIPRYEPSSTIVVAASKSILDDSAKNPKDVRAARQFLNYYLDATIKIVARYADLARKEASLRGDPSSLKRAESMLDMIRSAFEKQHARLLEDESSTSTPR